MAMLLLALIAVYLSVGLIFAACICIGEGGNVSLFGMALITVGWLPMFIWA
jgi:hypothetical protein